MAIITRWRMPPESWNGYQRTRCSGEGIPTERSSSTAVDRASFLSMSRWRRSDSPIWSPIRLTGLRAVIGSWKIMRQLGAPHLAQRAVVHGRQLVAGEVHGAAADHVAGREQAHDRAGQDGLARAGLAHDAEGLALVDLEGDPVDGPHGAPLGAERRCGGPRRPAAARRGCRRP